MTRRRPHTDSMPDDAPLDDVPSDDAPLDGAPLDDAPLDDAPLDEAPPDEAPPASVPFRDRVYAAVRAVPYGKVASYGGIAAAIGQPRAARAVGRALGELGGRHAAAHDAAPDPVPWWRVVNSAGAVAIRGAFHDATVQRALLEGEGVGFSAAGRVDWRRCGWTGPTPDTLPTAAEPTP